jgi:SSS family solute:Na+ symporter
MNWVALLVFLFFFILIATIGFLATHWRKGDLTQLHEWGLGGRRFGTWITWFLLGGDLYTAYTFLAVPALAFGLGAIGFFILPVGVMNYIFVFCVFPALWTVCKRRGHVTAADFIQDRFDSRFLSLVMALTGILSTLPYIALQLIGIQMVVGALGFPMQGFWSEVPLIVAFLILAIFTYTSGLRGPAMISIVKDVLMYITVIAAVVYIPMQLGGYGEVFGAVPVSKLLLTPPSAESMNQFSLYATTAIGSGIAVFLYPHATTALLSASSANTIRRNMVLLPIYAIVMGLMVTMGYMALASQVRAMPEYAQYFDHYGVNFAIPAMLMHFFPSWMLGLAFAAIAISALVPSSIMSIAAANLFTRNVYRNYLHRECDPARESHVAKLFSLVVKAGALIFVILLPLEYAAQMALLAGIWIIQTSPGLVFGLFTRWVEWRGVLVGWLVGAASGTWMMTTSSFTSSAFTLHIGDYMIPGYAAVYSLVLNVVATLLVSGLMSFDKRRLHAARNVAAQALGMPVGMENK